MQYLDLTLPTPAENLACDEALLDACEAGGPEVLRFWEAPTHFVVLGYANRVATEVKFAECRARGLPVCRRITGGGTVLQGPGCLNYSAILRIREEGPTASIPQTNLWIMNRHAAALTALLGQPVRRRGDTDLALADRKFSGNAQRRGRRALLFHGAFLIDLDLALLDALLPLPSREPDYRAGRSHGDFVMNLALDRGRLKSALRRVWETRERLTDWPAARTEELTQTKYCRDEWNHRF